MKKTIALLLALLMALCLFAGCGDKAAEPAPAEPAAEPAVEEPAAPADAAVPAAEPAAPAGDQWAEYQQYLKDNSQGAPNYEEFAAQVDALTGWADVDQTTSPWDMLFSENGPYLSTFEEFCAGTVRAAAVGGSDPAASGDKASGTPSGDKKASGVPSGDKKASGVPSGDKASGAPSGDAAAAPPAAAGTGTNSAHGGNGDTSEAAYKEYLKAWVAAENAANDQMDDNMQAEFYAAIDAGTLDVFPADMLFNGMLNTGAAMTYDEFVAAGGMY